MRRVTDFEFDTFGIFEGQAVVTEVEAGSCGVEIVRFHVGVRVLLVLECWVCYQNREELFGNREQSRGEVESLPEFHLIDACTCTRTSI